MQPMLHGKVAVIAGAGTAIGRAACLTFARQGARIVAADPDTSRAEAIAAQVREAGGEAIACACEVAEWTQADDVVAAAVAAFGRLDIMFNNAGVTIRPRDGKPPPGRKGSGGAVARYYRISVDGVANGCAAALRQFEAQGGGGAIVITDLVARLTAYGNVRYDPSTSAVGTLTRATAITAAEHKVRVNAFSPAGMSASYQADDVEGDDEGAVPQDANPLGCTITPEACAEVALFLASDLGRAITGVNLPVDGGLLAQARAPSDQRRRGGGGPRHRWG